MHPPCIPGRENERRWLSLDLCGCLTRDRPMWDYLRDYGVEEAELNWFLDNPCPPDAYWN